MDSSKTVKQTSPFKEFSWVNELSILSEPWGEIAFVHVQAFCRLIEGHKNLSNEQLTVAYWKQTFLLEMKQGQSWFINKPYQKFGTKLVWFSNTQIDQLV